MKSWIIGVIIQLEQLKKNSNDVRARIQGRSGLPENLSGTYYKSMGCSPSSSEITISESVGPSERGSDLGIGFITCKEKGI